MRLDFGDLSTPTLRDAFAARAFAGHFVGPPGRGPRVGGRAEGLAQLAGYDAARYGRTRNFLDAPVSRLSPYLRHGMLTMPEVRDQFRERYKGDPAIAEEFLKQLAWRDFFEKVLDWHGVGIEDDLEPPRHHVPRGEVMPPDIAAGTTGLPCMDGILAGLFENGYLHNHERLWFAAYLCHFRGVSWKRGAELFRQYLYDGDWASNNSSWQWVEGTFANKPYFMNQENISTFSHDKWCATCRVPCPFRASYEQLQVRLFEGSHAPLAGHPVAKSEAEGGAVILPVIPPTPAEGPPLSPAQTLVYVHDAALSPEDVSVKAHPNAALVFVFDAERLAREPWAFHRFAFVLDGLAEVFAGRPGPSVQIRFGDPATELRAALAESGAKALAFTDHPNPGVRQAAEACKGVAEVKALPRPTLAEYAEEPVRFTRYWKRVAPQVLGHAAKGGKKFHR